VKQRGKGLFALMDAHRKSLLFAAKFFLIYGILQAIIYIAPISALTNFIAALEGNALGLQFAGDKIAAGDALYVITNSCTGLVSWSILAAIIFSLRKPAMAKKLQMALLGGALLFIINLFRVAAVILVGLGFGHGTAEFAHTVSWFAMSAFVLGVWFLLTKRLTGIKDFSELL